MHKNPTARPGLFDPRVLGAFTFSVLGVLLATLSFAIGPGTWSPTGSMVTPRQHHAAALISPCETLVVGGDIAVDNGLQATALRFQNTDDTWRDAPPLHTKRQFHTATSLSTAGQILVAGGVGSDGNPLATAELFDEFNGNKWTFTGNMTTPRYAHSAVLLTTGQVLVAGGIAASGGPLAGAELFDPSTGTWTNTGSMNTPRHDHTATLLSNGQVLVTGGIGVGGSLSSAELYDPTTGTWSANVSRSGSGSDMTTDRAFHTATALNYCNGFDACNGDIILISGGVSSSGVQASAELYSVELRSFIATGSMSSARQAHTANLLSSGQVLVAGGNDGSSTLASAELYDPGGGVWLPTASMAAARQGHISAPLPITGVCAGSTTVGAPADFVLVAGGNGAGGLLASAELYDQAHRVWVPASDMGTHRVDHTATLLPNGKVLVVGGHNGGGSLDSAHLYDPGTGTFSPTGSMSTGRDMATATLLPAGKVLVTGGFSPTGHPLSSTELYDPATAKWSLTGDMTIARAWHAATLLGNGKVLVTAGEDPTFNVVASAELYDPATGTWSATGNMLEGYVGHTATLLNTSELLIVGNTSFPQLYEPATGTFRNTNTLIRLARFLPAAALLPTGNVLVAGGQDSGVGIASVEAELYDPQYDPTTGYSGEWTVTGFMKNPRLSFPMVVLQNGNALVAGGRSGGVIVGNNEPIASCEVYVPAGANWQATGSMTDSRTGHTGTLLNTGKVLATGGLNNQGLSLATAELFDPGPPLSFFSCDGVNVVTDPAGDAINPAPGGAGPTDQADIVGISFSTDSSKTTLITTMTLHNLSQVPSPGTTFTTYNVVWTSSNGTQYATQVSAPDPSGTISYLWGPWDPDNNQLTPFTRTTGTFNTGPNGTITVNVPLSGIGEPTIPITDTSEIAAVTNPFGLTFAGEGALGNGTRLAPPMDVAPDSGGGQRWAVCPPPPVQLNTVVSRKIHGSAGTFDIDLPLSGNPGIECRSGGATGDYMVVFTFSNPLTNVTGATVSNGMGLVASSNIDSSDAHNYIVNLTGVTNAQHIAVTLSKVADSVGNFSPAVAGSMGVLIGDVNASGRVDAADVSSVRQQTLVSVTNSNFRNDINASGRIDAADVSIARQQTLTSLP